jgi:hypothetical protein
MIVLSAVCALGLGLAASTGASAAPMSGLNNSTSVNPMLQPVARFCRVDRRCWRGPFGRRHCEVRRVCRGGRW